MHGRLVPLLLASVLAAAVFPATAQDNPGVDNAGMDDPSRGVARLSVVQGDVSVRRGDAGEMVAAAVNAPLLAQDSVLTGPQGVAEIQFNSSQMLRIASSSEVNVPDLEYNRFQIQVATGTVTFRVLQDPRAQMEIDTPSVSVRPTKRGSYRVTVNADGTSEITVREGAADIYTPQGSQELEAGQTMMARGSASDPEFQINAAIPLDSWDQWNQDRDRDLERYAAQSRQYVSPDVYGTEDLGQYGQWQNDPTYGNVWAPTVAAGWAPYQQGRWVWEDWYGWTWVSYDPWGWAPYHYGRWFYGRSGWCWWPGGRYSRDYWRPALVGFFGFGGGGLGVGFGFGNLGWVPLAPYEALHPWWGRYGGFGRGYYGGFGRNTVVNNVNIVNIYRNSRVRGGMTAVNAVNFGRHVGRFETISATQVGRAGMLRGVLPVAPGRASLQFSNRAVRTAGMPAARNQQFFSRMRASSVQRVPFEQQRQAVAAVAQRAYGGRVIGAGPEPAGAAVGNRSGWPSANRAAAQPVAPGRAWQQGRQAAQPAASGRAWQQARGGAAPAAEQHGWQHFGAPVHSYGNQGGRAVAPAGRGYDRSAPAGANRGYSTPARPSYEPPQANRGASGSGWSRSNDRPSTANSGAWGGAARSGANQYAPSRGGFGSSNGAVRISPPIVRERQAPSYRSPSYQPAPAYRSSERPSYSGRASQNYGGPSYNGAFGSGRAERSAPSYSAPARNYGGGGFSAPRVERAPSRSYGGGGGFSTPRVERAPSRSYGGGGGFSGRSYGGGGGGHVESRGGGGGHSGGGRRH